MSEEVKPNQLPEPEAWDTAEMQRKFEVQGFAYGFCVVRRRSDGQVGSLRFSGTPRLYYDWTPDDGGV